MSWIRSSRTVAVVALLTIALLAAGTAAAVSFEAEKPEPAQVGDTVSMEVTMTDAFEAPLPSNYTLQTDTALQDPGWTIRANDVAGDTVAQEDVAADRATLDLNAEDGVSEVVIIIEGEVPEMSEFSYEDLEVENYTVMELSRVVDEGNSTLDGAQWTAHRYTEDSRNARQAIDNASAAVESAGSGEDDLNQAISVYNNGNFETAIELAEEAQSSAEGQEQTSQLLLIGGALVVLVALVGGGAYVYKQRQRDTNKLR